MGISATSFHCLLAFLPQQHLNEIIKYTLKLHGRKDTYQKKKHIHDQHNHTLHALSDTKIRLYNCVVETSEFFHMKN